MNELAGLRIAVTRRGSQADELCDRLSELGATPIRVPTIAVQPPETLTDLDNALQSIDRYDWVVFTSANGVRGVMARAAALGLGPRVFSDCRVAAVGPATASALEQAGIDVAAVPAVYLTGHIANAMDPAPGTRALLLRADIASATLPRLLAERGVTVDEVTAYRTTSARPDEPAMAALRAGVDVITFTSPSTVRGFVEAFGADWRDDCPHAVIATIGPVTTAAAVEYGLFSSIEASEHTTAGLVQALCTHFAAVSENGTDG